MPRNALLLIIPPIRRAIIGITIASQKGGPRMLLLSPKLTWFCTRVPKHSRTWGVHHLHGRNKKVTAIDLDCLVACYIILESLRN